MTTSLRSGSFSRRSFAFGTLALGVALNGHPVGTSAQSTPVVTAGTAIWVKYNLNSITSDQILSIPSAGDQMTREFEEYRPYTSIVQFRTEIGKYVDSDVVAGYEKYVFVPIDPATADADTIAQLPGLTSDNASSLVGAASDDAGFLAALTPLVSTDQLEQAKQFLASANAAEVSLVKYNLDTITSDQILAIPNAGDQMTREFQEYRPYTSIEEFRQEIGKYVDADIVAGYEQYVYVAISPNDATDETLVQLPGLRSDGLSTLTGQRPFADNAAFLGALGKVVSEEQASLAAAWLVQ